MKLSVKVRVKEGAVLIFKCAVNVPVKCTVNVPVLFRKMLKYICS